MGLSAADLGSLGTSVDAGLQSAAAQRQMIANNAAKQLAGQYTTSGTSGALYNYMHDRGGYPVKAVPSNAPIVTGGSGGSGGSGSIYTPLSPTVTAPKVAIDPITNVVSKVSTTSDPLNQTKTATDAATGPTKMGAITKAVVPQATPLQQLMAIAGPASLGYYALSKSGGLDALSNYFANNPVYDAAGSQLAPSISNYFNTPASAAPAASTVETAALDALPSNYVPYTAPTVGPAVDAAAINNGIVSDSAVSDVALKEAADRAAQQAAAQQAAAQQAAEEEAAAQQAAAQQAAEEEAARIAAEQAAAQQAAAAGTGAGIDTAATAGDYVNGADLASDLVSGGGEDLISSFLSSDLGSAIAAFFGFKEGGQVGNSGLTAAYANGGMARGGSAHQPFFSKSTGKFNYTGPKVYADGGGISVGGISQAVPNSNQDLIYQNNPTIAMATGGVSNDRYNLGGYSDGGRLLRGPGDGVSDSIPATIGGRQPARLADGEFVVPARIVSEIGNGSTEAGARKLYAMMERVQAARKQTVGKGRVAKNTHADKYLPK